MSLKLEAILPRASWRRLRQPAWRAAASATAPRSAPPRGAPQPLPRGGPGRGKGSGSARPAPTPRSPTRSRIQPWGAKGWGVPPERRGGQERGSRLPAVGDGTPRSAWPLGALLQVGQPGVIRSAHLGKRSWDPRFSPEKMGFPESLADA